jgi:N-acetylglutamate synthase-like GNAT family acetyltransferase
MTTQALQVRRATIEDLPQLIELWKAEQLPVSELEKHFKEFQVIGENNKLIAAVAMRVVTGDGLLHSEVFAHPEQADSLREKIWERARMIAGNHGLYRVWTQMAAPFWKGAFQEASPELVAKLPAGFANENKSWLCVQLKDEAAVTTSLDKEFALFREAEREQTQKLFRQAHVLKIAAIALGIGLFALVITWAIMFFKAQQRIKTNGQVEPEIRVVEVAR